MAKALTQNLETIAALQSFCIFGYQTEDSLATVTQPDYFTSCAARLMANDLILICADAGQSPAWGLFLICNVGPHAVLMKDMAGREPEKVNGLSFIRSLTKAAIGTPEEE